MSHHIPAQSTTSADFQGNFGVRGHLSSFAQSIMTPQPAQMQSLRKADPMISSGHSVAGCQSLLTHESQSGTSFVHQYMGYPSAPHAVLGNLPVPPTEDFSHLFLERGVPDYKSPTPQPQSGYNSGFGDIPVTPTTCQQAGLTDFGDEDETRTVDSWGAPTNYMERFADDAEPNLDETEAMRHGQ